VIDCGVGLDNVQLVELEHYCGDAGMLRIDELAELGCCCFCSVLYIANDNYIAKNPDKVLAFMSAVRRATNFLLQDPNEAYKLYCEVKPILASDINKKIFDRSLPFFSKSMENVERDWNKVRNYCIRLKLIGDTFQSNFTNTFVNSAKNAK